jgi:class 3 adenylate cyclase
VVPDVPETRYAKTAEGAHIAYQVVGDGSVDLLFDASGGGSHVEVEWELPAYARVFRRLAAFSRLIRLDFPGTGLSDPLGLSEQRSLEEQATGALAVLDAAGSERAALVANAGAGLLAIFLAASYPTRVLSLVLVGCYARLARAADYPLGVPKEVLDRAVAQVQGGAGSAAENGLMYIAPDAMRDPEFVAQWHRHARSIGGPGTNRAVAEMLVHADVRPALAAIQAPTLVLYRSGDLLAGKPHAVYLAEHISDARLVDLPGRDNLIFAGDSDAVVDEIEEFLTGRRPAPEADRVLATVLFTDIVGSTDRIGEVGDRRWRELLITHDMRARAEVERFRGRLVKSTGDGVLATFDGPGRAIRCACAIRDSVRPLGIDLRAGLHTGEIEVLGDDVAGMAVHIGARVSALAGPGEVLVSSTVKDLVAGSGIEFDNRGENELKGVPGTWKLYAVVG